MILESVEHGPLVWPMIEENGVTKTKKYEELFATEKIQADYDLKETSIILQGLPSNAYSLVNTKFLNSLPPEWSKFVMTVNSVKYFPHCQLLFNNAYLEQHELHANEVRIMRERSQDPLALVVNHQMTPSHFNTYQSSYNNPQFQQQFSPSQSPQYGLIHPTQHYSSTYPSTPLAITYPSTPDSYALLILQYISCCPQYNPFSNGIYDLHKGSRLEEEQSLTHSSSLGLQNLDLVHLGAGFMYCPTNGRHGIAKRGCVWVSVGRYIGLLEEVERVLREPGLLGEGWDVPETESRYWDDLASTIILGWNELTEALAKQRLRCSKRCLQALAYLKDKLVSPMSSSITSSSSKKLNPI
ncbi:hypothetical protein Tco_0154148 [Tanacetum coccineum]